MYFLLDKILLPFHHLFLGYEKVVLLLILVQSEGARGSNQ